MIIRKLHPIKDDEDNGYKTPQHEKIQLSPFSAVV